MPLTSPPQAPEKQIHFYSFSALPAWLDEIDANGVGWPDEARSFLNLQQSSAGFDTTPAV
jgi:hypothetical protein